MTRKIYLRAVVHNGELCLAMYDSNGHGDINDLTTFARPGDKIHWKLDHNSGIERINKIHGRRAGARIFRQDPAPVTNREFVLQLQQDINRGLVDDHSEKYLIECTLRLQGLILKIDPYIKIPPP